MILVRQGNTYFFYGCSLYCDGLYVGSGAGSGDRVCRVLECTDGVVTARLVEDGYVSYEGGVLEVGLLRDYGGWVGKKEFEDGTIYIYSSNVNGNGLFEYTATDGLYYLERAVAGSILASTAAVVLGGCSQRPTASPA